jgi:hypothetical protein
MRPQAGAEGDVMMMAPASATYLCHWAGFSLMLCTCLPIDNGLL